MNILYLGDNTGTSAEYLKDCLKELEHNVTHFDSNTDVVLDGASYNCIIVSDYPAQKLTSETTEVFKKMVQDGARFIMIGGWDSFNGRGSNYYNHPLSEILPVKLQAEDDRVNAPQGLVLCPEDTIPQTDVPLDWINPPIICGYNAVESKATAQTLVWAKPVQTNGKEISLLQPQPLLVKESYGSGTALACTTDLAPHWCGGLVDWGSERRAFEHVEVGDMYINFIRFLLEV